jgi:hypothetical protein
VYPDCRLSLSLGRCTTTSVVEGLSIRLLRTGVSTTDLHVHYHPLKLVNILNVLGGLLDFSDRAWLFLYCFLLFFYFYGETSKIRTGFRQSRRELRTLELKVLVLLFEILGHGQELFTFLVEMGFCVFTNKGFLVSQGCHFGTFPGQHLYQRILNSLRGRANCLSMRKYTGSLGSNRW